VYADHQISVAGVLLPHFTSLETNGGRLLPPPPIWSRAGSAREQASLRSSQ
jgi:hypothetical protein